MNTEQFETNPVIRSLERKIEEIQTEQTTHRLQTNAKIKLLRDMLATERKAL